MCPFLTVRSSWPCGRMVMDAWPQGLPFQYDFGVQYTSLCIISFRLHKNLFSVEAECDSEQLRDLLKVTQQFHGWTRASTQLFGFLDTHSVGGNIGVGGHQSTRFQRWMVSLLGRPTHTWFCGGCTPCELCDLGMNKLILQTVSSLYIGITTSTSLPIFNFIWI